VEKNARLVAPPSMEKYLFRVSADQSKVEPMTAL
jgi:hypothetical protein